MSMTLFSLHKENTVVSALCTQEPQTRWVEEKEFPKSLACINQERIQECP